MVQFAAVSTAPQHASLRRPRRLKLLRRARRNWWARFWDPNELFGLKLSLLLCCYVAGSAIA